MSCWTGQTPIVTMSVSHHNWCSTVHGVRVVGETALLPTFGAARSWTHQLHVTFQTADVSLNSGAPAGDLIAHQVWQGETEYAFYRSASSLSFTFPGFCSGVVDLNQGTLELRAANADDASLVFPNTILSAFLGYEGDLVLHGSAVALDGGAVVFCGPSGSGKSTVAAAMALSGTSVITDDALRVTFGAGSPRCFPGVPELRLRQTRGWTFAPHSTRLLSDGRTAYLPDNPVEAETELRALVFPCVSPAITRPSLVRLRGEHCLRRLLSASRITWTTRGAAEILKKSALLGHRTSTYELNLPEHYLIREESREALLEMLGRELRGSS